ncbi:MAG: hypothetical protein P3T54_01570 [Dehalogenimonas sp.]|uniref:Helix-turn-helix domain-containing protein n=1 Tax=Candidatus Dehalogenimonas loeffleri TaxID=3127115 RepID=A0ABZ2J5M3_9CHLR|nr:hypothetical protein [Dehalogenimonas sp.]
MKELSATKVVSVLRMYFAGFSYEEIAVKNNVSKGTVFNVVADLKSGLFPEAANLSEDIDLLREAAIDLKNAKLTPVKVVVGISLLSTLASLNIEPSELGKFQSVIKGVAAPGTDTSAFAKATLALHDMQASTGLSVPEVEAKVANLQSEVTKLEPLVKELQTKKKMLDQTQDALNTLTVSKQQAQIHFDQLQKDIEKSHVNQAKIISSTTELEKRAHLADLQLTEARQDIKKLAIMGFTLEGLGDFTQHVKEVAFHHKIKPSDLKDRLFNELKAMDKLMGIESACQKKAAELASAEHLISERTAESSALTTSNNQLHAQRNMLLKDIAAASDKILKAIDTINQSAQVAGEKLCSKLQSGISEALQEVDRMIAGAQNVGQQIGEYETMVSANEWLHQLLALAKNEDIADGGKVRVIGLMLLKPMAHWLNRHGTSSPQPYLLKVAIENAVKEMEQWQPQIINSVAR